MKEYIDGGITPDEQRQWLERNAKLEGVTTGNGMTNKYFTLGDNGFKVICYEGIAIQLIKFKAEEVKTMVACSKLKFGGF